MSLQRFRMAHGFSMLLALAVAPSAGAQGKTIKIASQSPLSGGQAALGEGIKLGTQLAIEKFKGNLEKQGFKVEFVPYDDQAKPDVGVANAREAVPRSHRQGWLFNSFLSFSAVDLINELSVIMVWQVHRT